MPWAPDYCNLAELKSVIKIDDSEDDAWLGFCITAASRAIDRHTYRQFGQITGGEPRSYAAVWDRRRQRYVVEIDDLQDPTGLTVAVEAGTIDLFELQPVNAVKKGKVFTHLVVDPDAAVKPTGREENEVTATGKWGWTAFPTPVKTAAILQSSRLQARRGSPYGVAGSPELGSELRLLARLDPDVAVSLGDYVRWWGAA